MIKKTQKKTKRLTTLSKSITSLETESHLLYCDA